ncbi:hypothetical protein GQ42DRAFT_50467 [Ramicandelaber brevisporus]|nr:hypothetical protein GQ42DRAFT_50467 [Ramicandelaber brevisporus]
MTCIYRRIFYNSSSNGLGGKQRISIMGWTGGTPESLLEFLHRKASSPVQISELHVDGKLLYISVPDRVQADVLLALNGIRFAQGKLTFRNLTGQTPRAPATATASTTTTVAAAAPPFQQAQYGNINSNQSVPNRIAALEAVLHKRYDANNKRLILDNIVNDAEINLLGITSMGQDRHDQYHGRDKQAPSASGAEVLLKLTSKAFPDVASISFASNNMQTVLSISKLPVYLPRLQSLHLNDNPIGSFRDLEYLGQSLDQPLNYLSELTLKNTPLFNNEMQRAFNAGHGAEPIEYVNRVISMYPTVRKLDGEAVVPYAAAMATDLVLRPEQSQQAGSARRFPPSNYTVSTRNLQLVRQSRPQYHNSLFFDSDETKGTAFGFLEKYFTAFDTARSSLVHAYDPCAQFSFSLSKVKVDSTSVPQDVTNALYATFDELIPSSRNLDRLRSNHPTARVANVSVGPQNIVNTLTSKFPANIRHPLKHGELFTIDAYYINNVAVHAGAATSLLALGGSPQNPTTGAQTNVVMFISVSGFFGLLDKQVMVGFDRTFVIAQSPANSNALKNGWPVVILSDILSLRHPGAGVGLKYSEMNWSAAQPQPQPQPVPVPTATAIVTPARPIPMQPAPPVQTQPQPAPFAPQPSYKPQQHPPVPPPTTVTSAASAAVASRPLALNTSPANAASTATITAPANAAPVVRNPNYVGLSAVQVKLCSELQRHTLLSDDFTFQCLHENGWNIERAAQAFQKAKDAGVLPAHAFDATQRTFYP